MAEKRTPLRRAFGDAVISLAALLFLLLMLVSLDHRVRDHVAAFIGTPPDSAELVGAGREITSLVGVVFEAVQDQSIAHAPMVIFGVVATVLVVFMVRI